MDTHNLVVDDGQKTVTATVHGDITASRAREIITDARTIAAEKGCNILYDVRHSSLRVSNIDLFLVARELEALQTPAAHAVKAAILAREDETLKYEFYQTLATRAGLNTGVFIEEQEASDWLACSDDPRSAGQPEVTIAAGLVPKLVEKRFDVTRLFGRRWSRFRVGTGT